MVTASAGVRPETLAAQIAHRIEDEVIAPGRPVGRHPGAEADLQEQFGVSRAVAVWIRQRVLTALLDGGDALARHRMRRRPTALTAWWH